MAAQDAPSLSRFLRMAVVTGVERAVRIHIDRGDDLNARDEKGQTPLMLSAARGNAAICRLLLVAGADAGLREPYTFPNGFETKSLQTRKIDDAPSAKDPGVFAIGVLTDPKDEGIDLDDDVWRDALARMYEIDLDKAPGENVGTEGALKKLGAI